MQRSSTISCSLDSVRSSLRHRPHFSFYRTLPGRHPLLRLKAEEEDIYLGEGRVVQDDPRKYPSKEDVGFIQGATGGWAGGETGFQRFVEGIEATEIPDEEAEPETSRAPKKIGEGSDKIYVGFDYKNPEDLAAMREGQPGNFVIDDESKYPGRDFIGWLPLQGGFAGGEMGVQKFVEDGVVPAAKPKEKRRSQGSPILIGIFVAAVATTGGLLLTGVIDFGESLTLNVDRAPLDEKTKLLLEIAIGLLFTAWIGSAALGFFKTVKERIDSGASSVQRLAVSVVFWCVVLVATYNLAKA